MEYIQTYSEIFLGDVSRGEGLTSESFCHENDVLSNRGNKLENHTILRTIHINNYLVLLTLLATL